MTTVRVGGGPRDSEPPRATKRFTRVRPLPCHPGVLLGVGRRALGSSPAYQGDVHGARQQPGPVSSASAALRCDLGRDLDRLPGLPAPLPAQKPRRRTQGDPIPVTSTVVSVFPKRFSSRRSGARVAPPGRTGPARPLPSLHLSSPQQRLPPLPVPAGEAASLPRSQAFCYAVTPSDPGGRRWP